MKISVLTTGDIKMAELSSDTLKKALKNLIFQTNIFLQEDVYSSILNKYKATQGKKYAQILKNVLLSKMTKRPMCQDTGVCIFFLEVGKDFRLSGKNIEETINEALAEAYEENYFRKSMAQSVLNRTNTKNNTPAIIYTDITDGNSLKISLTIKGGGSENVSAIKMMSPSLGEEGIVEFIVDTLKNAKDKGCPPYVVGIGLGGTIEKAAILSKKALLAPLHTQKAPLEEKIVKALENFDVLDVNIIEHPTHIASMAVAVNLSCHCSRHGEIEIFQDGSIKSSNNFDYELFEDFKEDCTQKRLKTDDVDGIKKLKKGDSVLLSGEIYTARDMAHKRMYEAFLSKEELPFDLKDKIIFYAGPCPAAPNEVIGPVGPTTSARMDKYLDMCSTLGLLGTIGKGERKYDDSMVYFTTTGGVACLLQRCVKKSELVAYENLGTEAVRKLSIEDFPVVVS